MNAQLIGHGFAPLTPRSNGFAALTPRPTDIDSGGYDASSYDRLPLMAGYLPSSMPQDGEEAEGRYPAEAVRAEAAEVRAAAQEVRAAAEMLQAQYTCYTYYCSLSTY